MIEPYRSPHSDQVWGEEQPEPLPREKTDLAGRARRARTDAEWKQRPERVKRALLKADAKDRKDGYRQ